MTKWREKVKKSLEVQAVETEKPLDECILEVLGEDPAALKSLNISIHPTFIQKWKYLIEKYIPESERKELCKKYNGPVEFEAPTLNPEIAASLGDAGCKRHAHRKET